jgi:Xaa-Pro aminopeptidase
MSAIHREKLEQARGLLDRSGIDVWLTFVRETAMGGDPVLPLLIEGGLTWHSALIVARTGERIAVVGNYDADPLKASGDWTEVIPYVQGIREPLVEVLLRLVPEGGKIGVNICPDDVSSDGLTVGMYQSLQSYLAGTRLEGSLVSAAATTMALRAKKTRSEVQAMLSALEATDQMFDDIARFAQIGVTERAVYDHVHHLARERGLGFSWDPAGDPIVNSGPNSMIGHGIPSAKIEIAEGHIFHIDLGLIKDGYSSDIQRCWYVGDSIPEDAQRAFDAVRAAILAGFAVLRPGTKGFEVDLAARKSIVASGYEEYLHALGHQVGRIAHDGGTILGPTWDRYGDRPYQPVEEDEVYTLELGVVLPGRGYLGLEEMVRVTSTGAEWLSTPQSELWLL